MVATDFVNSKGQIIEGYNKFIDVSYKDVIYLRGCWYVVLRRYYDVKLNVVFVEVRLKENAFAWVRRQINNLIKCKMTGSEFMALLAGLRARVAALPRVGGGVPQEFVDGANAIGDEITALEQAAQGGDVTATAGAAATAAKPAPGSY